MKEIKQRERACARVGKKKNSDRDSIASTANEYSKQDTLKSQHFNTSIFFFGFHICRVSKKEEKEEEVKEEGKK